MRGSVDDDEWEQSNEDEWFDLQRAVVHTLTKGAKLSAEDFEVSAIRDEPSTIDVLLNSNAKTIKQAVLDHVHQLQQILLGHSDHWVIRVFVRPSNWRELDNYEYYIWIKVRRAMYRTYLGQTSATRWRDLDEMERAVWSEK